MKKTFLLVVVFCFSIAFSGKAEATTAGFFRETRDMIALKADEKQGDPAWKACLDSPPVLLESGLWEISFNKKNVETTELGCYHAWTKELDGGTVIYINGAYYAEDTSIKREDEKPQNAEGIGMSQNTESVGRPRVLSGKFMEEKWDRIMRRKPYFFREFEGSRENEYRSAITPVCIYSITEEGTGDNRGFVIGFTVGENPNCQTPGELREDRLFLALKIVTGEKELYFQARRTLSLTTDNRIYAVAENAFQYVSSMPNRKKQAVLIYTPATRAKGLFSFPYVINYPFNPIIEKVDINDGFMAILHYGISRKPLEGYSLYSYSGKKGGSTLCIPKWETA